ncbi:hypothetical protein [Rhodococcus sp. NPDC058521]|uniref:hypothetical protein n=1 Tax=Rhodococcus sp. NPDC058521 TaxID=3346536 RepID=UPI00365AA496
MNIRKLAVRAIGAAAIATATLGLAAPAIAAPAPAPVAPGPASVPAPQLHLYWNGPFSPTVGQNDFCNGIIDTHTKTDPTRPGVAYIGLSSQGMHGVGPGWGPDSKCKVNVSIGWGAGVFTNSVREVELEFGPTPSEITWTEVPTGSGPQIFAIGASYADAHLTRFQPQFSLPVQVGILVP